MLYSEPETRSVFFTSGREFRCSYHCTFAKGRAMTPVEVLFRYGMPPGEKEMSALSKMNEVYGIRRMQFNEGERTIRIEYDATRLNEGVVEHLLRSAGVDVREKLALV